MRTARFPNDFVFGTATSAFQIEGGWDADGKGPSIWDTFSHTPGKIWQGQHADVACDHYHRYRDDVALMESIGVDAYRFSISWPRVLPEGAGRLNPAGIAFYDRLVDELLAAGIAPSATLFHWDYPQVLEDRGGWPVRDSIEWFADYAAVMFDALGDRVAQWSTLNEPIALWVGYGLGAFAPGSSDRAAAHQAMHHALVGHGRAVEAFRASNAAGDIGVVVDVWKRHPATESPEDAAAALRGEQDGFRFFFDPLFRGGYDPDMLARFTCEGSGFRITDGDLATIAQPVDFLGLNVYSRVIARAEHTGDEWWTATERHPGGNYLANGMEFYPRAVYDAIRIATDEYGVDVPIYITENGMSDTVERADGGTIDDDERVRYVSGFLEWIARARDEGADVRGYYLWSLMDNFEWAAGYSQRFGMVHVDWETLERTPKRSAEWYREVIRSRSVPSPVVAEA
ncbi:beta-glucosidase [Agromyces rhizosphaerae]|uniref:Beta-glucosidase n=1 Tax=Agromyces rhizosphaerae TaxID=88374 RepID=A0A9W6FQR8_9MICO|nr:GH1 family beta-glucosidase [Agromyces rhizosphaerae]GLI26358.1 beta-glucosidase [Agromyces rhizosphaerae]